MVQVMVTIKTFLNECSEKAKQHQELLILIAVVGAFIIILLVLTFAFLLIFPMWQVSRFGLNNVTLEATFENQYRTTLTQIIATFAQILGGGAVAIGIYFAWGNLTTARDGQITERFTRAIDQLGAIDKGGNPAIEIRLGGIYGLKRISTESDKDYWPIMEILTAYVRKNSPNTDIKNRDVHGVLEQKTISLDIQAILTVIRRRNNSFNNGESNSLDLSSSYLGWASLRNVNLAGATLQWANFFGSGLQDANFEGAILEEVIFEIANLKGTNFKGAELRSADFKKASLIEAIFIGADLTGSDFKEADLQGVKFEGAILGGANLKGAKNLTIDQLSKVETLYNATLDEKLRESLENKYPDLYDHLNKKPEYLIKTPE